MRGAGVWVVVALALAAAGLGAWFLHGGEGDSSDSLFEAEQRAAIEAGEGPVLAGTLRTPHGGAAEEQGRFPVPVRVTDEKGEPVAGIQVVARRRGDAGREGEQRLWEPGVQLLKSAQAGPGTTAPWPTSATSETAADGTATLVVTRLGEYELRAEPEAPRLGTVGWLLLQRLAPTRPIELRVLTGSRLHGRVVDGEGRGVAAFVHGSSYENNEQWISYPAPTAPGTGAFEFAAVPKGKVSLEVVLPGRMRVYARSVDTPHEGEVVIRLGTGATLLEGTVRKVDGSAVAGALVGVSLQQGLDPAAPDADAAYVRYFATTDAEGAWSVSGPYVGAVTQVEAVAKGFVTLVQAPPVAAWSGLTLALEKPGRLDLVLYEGGSVEGRVLEEGSQRPLEGAEVHVLPLSVDGRMGRPAPTVALSDAQGRYRVDGVAVGRNLVLVRHPSHHLPAQAALRKGDSGIGMVWDPSATSQGPPSALTFFLEREGLRVTRDLVLRAGTPVRGRVVDAKGEPVANADVVAGGIELGQSSWNWGVQMPGMRVLAVSGPDGRFEVPGLPPGPGWTLTARRAPLVGEPSSTFQIESTPPADVVLRMGPGGTVVGRVLDAEGRGLGGASLHAHAQSMSGANAWVQGRSAADGTFRLEGVPTGAILGLSAMHGALHAWSQLNPLAGGEVREGVELRILTTPTTGGVRVVLVDERGKPVAGKQVFVRHDSGNNSQANSDGKGLVTLPAMPSGRYTLLAGAWDTRSGVELGSIALPATDEQRIVWKEPPAATIEGLVVDPQGAPVPLCRVSVQSGGRRRGNQGFPEQMMFPGQQGGGGVQVVNGWFRQRASGPPPYTVVVSAPQDGDGQALNLRGQSVEVKEASTTPLRIALEPGLEVEGRVVDDRGQGLAGVGVSASGVAGTTDASGSFRLGGLQEGEVTITVSAPTPFVRPAPTKATVGQRDLLVRLTRGLVIGGELRGPNGTPTNAWINVSWQDPVQGHGNLSAGVNASGRWRVEGVPPDVVATVTAQIWDVSGQSTPPRTIPNVRPGTDDLVIEFTAGVTIKGSALEYDGTPIVAGYVLVTTLLKDGKESNTNHVQPAPDGTFEAVGIEPGAKVRLRAHSHKGAQSEAVEVEAPATGVRLVLPRRLVIRGRLPFTPRSGSTWRVFAWTEGEPRLQAQGRITDAQGSFAFEEITHPGPWHIGGACAEDDRYVVGGPFEAPNDRATVSARDGRSIEGVLLDAAGQPAGGATIQVSGSNWGTHIVSDERGAFRLRGLPPGKYHVMAWRDGSHVRQSDVEDGTTNLRLQFK